MVTDVTGKAPPNNRTLPTSLRRGPGAHSLVMSLSTQSAEPPTVECRNPRCDTLGKRWEFRDGKYCSTRCEVEADGVDALAAIKHDHRYCFTCGTRLKDLEGVPPEWFWGGFQKETSKAFIGTQFLRPEAAVGEVVRRNDPQIIGTGVICECGNTHHAERIPEIWEENPEGYAERILTALETEHEAAINWRAFWDWFGADNFVYAAGKAVDG